MSNFLEQAQQAAQQENWSLLNQCLQQLIQSMPPLANRSTDATGLDLSRQQVLELASQILAGGDFQDRWDVAKIFPKLGTAAIAPLTDVLQDEEADWELRWFAARILGEFDHPLALAALMELLRDADDEELSGVAAEALANLGTSAVETLSELLTDEGSRLLAVRSLSQIRRSEIIAPLLSVVDDPEIPVRTAAIEALSSFHDPRITPALINALNDPAALVRREAVMGLGLRNDLLDELDVVQLLRPHLWDFNLEVCRQTAIALGRLGTEAAATALYQVLHSPNTPASLQVEIVRALGWVSHSSALKYLQQALTLESVEVCQEAIAAFSRVEQPEAIPQVALILINWLRSEHPATQHASIKQAVALGLAQLGDLQALDLLLQLLADPDEGVKLHAIASLKKLDPQTAHQHLEGLANDNNLSPELRQGVAIALQEWEM